MEWPGALSTETEAQTLLSVLPSSCLHPHLILEACAVLPMAEVFPVLPASLNGQSPWESFFFITASLFIASVVLELTTLVPQPLEAVAQ